MHNYFRKLNKKKTTPILEGSAKTNTHCLVLCVNVNCVILGFKDFRKVVQVAVFPF